MCVGTNFSRTFFFNKHPSNLQKTQLLCNVATRQGALVKRTDDHQEAPSQTLLNLDAFPCVNIPGLNYIVFAGLNDSVFVLQKDQGHDTVGMTLQDSNTPQKVNLHTP